MQAKLYLIRERYNYGDLSNSRAWFLLQRVQMLYKYLVKGENGGEQLHYARTFQMVLFSIISTTEWQQFTTSENSRPTDSLQFGYAKC